MRMSFALEGMIIIRHPSPCARKFNFTCTFGKSFPTSRRNYCNIQGENQVVGSWSMHAFDSSALA